MAYFSENYNCISYPIGFDDSPGLRNAQLGAIHAVASYCTLQKQYGGLVVMPTGAGKTAVLMMTPYICRATKVLVVTPSVMVRGQIFDDFESLRTLRNIGVISEKADPPKVFELKNKYSEESVGDMSAYDVVIATPQCALALSEAPIRNSFDHIIIDEAHHVPAATWQQILMNMNHARHFLFTATPFRRDRKEIRAEIIYSYPLSLAYNDGIFGEIQYIPIELAPDKDKLIAKEAERVFLNDKQQGFEHYLMVRTDTKEKAKNLEAVYQEETSLRLKRIDSSMAYNTVMGYIKVLRDRKIDGIICVDMLGEGFDFPNLKIAAIHAPQKSLASTLQFIGRFARTNAEKIGTAKFIAMNDEELRIENQRLFASDAVWQKMIIDLSEKRINQVEELRQSLSNFEQDSSVFLDSESISLHSIRPNCHAKVYHVSGFNQNGKFPDFCGVDESRIFRDRTTSTIIGIGRLLKPPLWADTDKLLDSKHMLFIVHYQAETSLIFVYSKLKHESDYQEIAEAFTLDFEKIPRSEMNRVLGGFQGYEFFNTGIQNRFAENGESYRIMSGSNVASSLDPITGKMYSAGHAFCRAVDGEVDITIGYSSGSKIWSSKYASIPDYIQWCDSYGRKISDASIIVKTNTNYDYIPIPTRMTEYPVDRIVFCFFPSKSYNSPPVIVTDEMCEPYLIVDATLAIIEIQSDTIKVRVDGEGISDIVTCYVDGNVVDGNTPIRIRDGRDIVTLANYLMDNPLEFKTVDDTMIIGNEICSGNPSAIIYNQDSVTAIDWNTLDTDITVEVGKVKGGKLSIHDAVSGMLISNSAIGDFVLYDHSSGEIADFIVVTTNDLELKVKLYHIKAMKGGNFNSSLDDIYEVCQQSVKSTVWLKSRSYLLEKIRSRRKSDNCKMVKGVFGELEKALKEPRLFVGEITIIQPAISKSVELPIKFQEILAASHYYINQSGRVKAFSIWGSI